MVIRYRLPHPGQGTLSELPDKHLVRVQMITKQTSHGNNWQFLARFLVYCTVVGAFAIYTSHGN